MTTTITGAAGINRVADGADMPAGSVIQVANFQTGALITGTVLMPHDDTVHQNTEGIECMTLAITPTATSSRLKIEVVLAHLGHSAITMMSSALFMDSVSNSLASTGSVVPYANEITNDRFIHIMTAPSTDLITFKVRCGGSNSGTTTFNGKGGSRRYGGVCASSITITEIAG